MLARSFTCAGSCARTSISSTAATATSTARARISQSSTMVLFVVPTLTSSFRELRKQHNYRHERYHRLLNKHHRYSRVWELKPGQEEQAEMTGHELEAFENFARYAHDARIDPSLEIATNDLLLLDPRERYTVITNMLDAKQKTAAVRDGRSDMERLRLTLMAAECFEELCMKGEQGREETMNVMTTARTNRKRRRTIYELQEDDQHHFRSCLLQVVNIASKSRRDHPDGSVAAILRAVQIASNVREDDLRRNLTARAREYVEEMDDPFKRKILKKEQRQEELLKVSHERPTISESLGFIEEEEEGEKSQVPPPLRVFQPKLESTKHYAKLHQQARNANISSPERYHRKPSTRDEVVPSTRHQSSTE